MNKGKILRIIGLLFLMWASVAGQYMNYIDALGYGKCCLAGLIETAVISLVMVLIPMIFRLVNKNRLEYNKGRKICKWNSILLFILSIFLSVINDGLLIGIGGIGAIMFYYINKWLFVYDENRIGHDKRTNIKKVEESIIIAEDTKELSKVAIRKTKYCKLCGGKLEDNNKCKKCGKQYFKFNKLVCSYFFICVLLITNLITIFICIDKNRELNDVIYSCNENDSWCETTMDILTDGNSWTYTSDKLDFYDENIVFVIEGYGNYFFSYDCVQKITGGEEYSYWAYNKEAAISKGYQKGICFN